MKGEIMQSKIKSVIIIVVTIILCMVVITAGTLSLFTDGTKVTNHLEAGTLDATLTRISLDSRTIGNDGVLRTNDTDSSTVDFTEPTDENVFGSYQDAYIVPGTYYEATLVLKNNGNIAFDYTVDLTTSSENDLADQLKVIVNGDEQNAKTLKQFKEDGWGILNGRLTTQDTEVTFTVKLVFLELDNNVNNLAQTLKADFDLHVTATQAVD